ncbi:MAG: hypothetical protein HZB51_27445 [Chloroflexi bacterium]|nr:hypothetical protein [Chloroflexota bacterium]
MKLVRLFAIAMVALIALSAAACAPAPTATPIPTPVPPTQAPVPVTAPTATTVPPTQAPTTVPPTAAPTASSATSSSPATMATALMLAKTALGNVLADQDGKMLYMFTKDTKDTSTCYETCATNWPPLLADKIDAKEGVDAKLIGYTKRTDGKMQVTYNGMPLYYYVKDTKAGDTLGQGVNNAWYVVTADGKPIKPAQLSLIKTSLGDVLADGEGRVLYLYTKDTLNPSVSNCYDQCAVRWPILYTDGNTTAKEGIDAKLIGKTTRKDGTMQVTYNGWPVYYWQNDKKAGDTLGQAVGGVWWVLLADGSSITSAAAPSVVVQLAAGRDGDQSGTATLTSKGDKTDVVINIKPGAAGVAQPAHVHEGACPVPGAVKYPLKEIVDGKSTTTLDVSLQQLLAGGFAINAHQSAAEVGKYVACGAIPQGSVVALGAGRDGNQPGAAILTAQGTKTQIDLFIKPLPGTVHPAHVHEGACPVPGGVKYPLKEVVDGRSTTVVEAALADLLKGGFAINAHLSSAEVGKYVSCGNLKVTAQIAPAANPIATASNDDYYK